MTTYIPRPGQNIHVCSYSKMGRWIRAVLSRWHRHFCEVTGQEFSEVKGSHDGIIVPCRESKHGVGVGESLMMHGTIITPWEDYIAKIEQGKCDVWIFDVIGATSSDDEHACDVFILRELGKRYDYRGIFCFLGKALTYNYSEIVKDWEWANWCTETVGICWKHLGVFQTEHPTPLTTEQCAGWLARKPGKKTTLELAWKSL